MIEEVRRISIAPGTWVEVAEAGVEVRYEGDAIEEFQVMSDGTVRLHSNTDDWLLPGQWFVRVRRS